MKFFFQILLFLGSCCISAQEQDALVFFTQKSNIETFLAAPATMLSQKAIDRKNNHATPIDARDVPVDETYISYLKNQVEIVVLAKSKWLNCAFVRGTKTAIENLSSLEFVGKIEFVADTLNALNAHAESRPKFYVKRQQRVNYNYGSALNQTEMIAADNLHEQNFTGDGIIIAVMDSGFPNITENPGFSTLLAENRMLGTYDFVNRQRNVRGTGSHGVATLSDMAGILDNFVGTAPKASYYLFRTEYAPSENPVEEAWWVEALERADSLGVDVVNTSLGYRDFDNPAYNHSYQELDGQTTIAARGANIAFEKGLLIVTSAGNGGSSDFKTVGTPADSPNVLSIGAVDDQGDYAIFSSTGPTVDGRVKPDIVAQGQAAAILEREGGVAFANGTSFSSPVIAGAVACLWQALPDLTNAEIMQLVRESASLYQSPTDKLGYGIPNFETALANGRLLGINNAFVQNTFVLQANPVNTRVIFSFPKRVSKADVQFFDLLGQEVLFVRLSRDANSTDISHLNTGIYIAKVSGGGKTKTFKVIKR